MREKRQQAISWQSDWALGFPGSSIVHRRRSWLRVAGEMTSSSGDGVGDGIAVGGDVGVGVGIGVSLSAVVGEAKGSGSWVGPATGVVEVHAAASRARAGRAAKNWTLGMGAEVGPLRMVDLQKGKKCNRQPDQLSFLFNPPMVPPQGGQRGAGALTSEKHT